MRLLALSILALPLLALLPAPAPAAPPAEEGAAAPIPFRNETYGIALAGPAGWKVEIEGPRASGRWIDLVAYREPKTRAYLCVSCQVSTYASFEEMEQKLGEYYRGLSDIFLLRGPERRAGAMNLRGPGLFLEFQQTTGKRTDRSFLMFWLNGRHLVRAYGSVAEKDHKKVEAAFQRFPESFRLTARSPGIDRPNFEHEEARCSLVFPEGWTVRLPARGPVAAFEDERQGVGVWLYRSPFEGDLAAFRSQRIQNLRDEGASVTGTAGPQPHEKRGEPVVVLDYTSGSGEKVRRYREICLRQEGAIYRLVLGGTPATFERGLPALERMVETLRLR